MQAVRTSSQKSPSSQRHAHWLDIGRARGIHGSCRPSAAHTKGLQTRCPNSIRIWAGMQIARSVQIGNKSEVQSNLQIAWSNILSSARPGATLQRIQQLCHHMSCQPVQSLCDLTTALAGANSQFPPYSSAPSFPHALSHPTAHPFPFDMLLSACSTDLAVHSISLVVGGQGVE